MGLKTAHALAKKLKVNNWKFYTNETLVAEVNAESLVLGGGALVYKRDYKEPVYFKQNKLFKHR